MMNEDENDDDDDDDDCKTSAFHNFTQDLTTRPETTLLRHSSLPMMNMASHYLQAKKQRNLASKEIFAPIRIIQPVTIIPMEPKLGAKMGTKKKLLGVFTLTFNDFLSTSPPKKRNMIFGMGDYILFGCQWLPHPEPKALIMLQARYATCFPTSQMDFTSRFTKQHGPRFFEEFRGTNALLIQGICSVVVFRR